VVLAGRSIYALHDVGELDLDPAERGIAIVIFGHSHRPKIDNRSGVLFLNPGSAGHRRFNLPVTLATVGPDPRDDPAGNPSAGRLIAPAGVCAA
jgi:predicted phosphodiesterase